MKVNNFKIEFNTKNEMWFVQKIKDELTKNDRDQENIVSGFMPENKDDRLYQEASSTENIYNTSNLKIHTCGKHHSKMAKRAMITFGKVGSIWAIIPFLDL